MDSKYGMCCGCEAKQPLVRSSSARQEERERGFDDWEIDQQYGESIDYIVASHDFYGSHCDGSGQIPQVIFDN